MGIVVLGQNVLGKSKQEAAPMRTFDGLPMQDPVANELSAMPSSLAKASSRSTSGSRT